MAHNVICRLICLFLILQSVWVTEGRKCGCPHGFVGYNGSCYWFSNVKANFWNAIRQCRRFKSHLAVITSRAEDNFIRNFAQRYGRALTYWLDGSDLREEGTWTWENPHKKIRYANWSPGQPDNHSGVEHCLEIRKPFGNYQWNDYQCKIPGHFICETSMR